MTLALAAWLPTVPQAPVVTQRIVQQQPSAVLSTTTLVAERSSDVFPTTMVAGVINGAQGVAKASPNAIPGAAKDLDLGSMLDTVPDDMHGDKGLAKDQAGVDRLKSRQAAIESAAKEKAELMLEMGL